MSRNPGQAAGEGFDAPMDEDIAPNSRFDKSLTFDSDNSDDEQVQAQGIKLGSCKPQPARFDLYEGISGYPADMPSPRPGAEIDSMVDASSELTELFGLVSSFQANIAELTVHWKPFLPPLVPAIGAIDAFIKVPRPDAELDEHGLVTLDEPSISQSNQQILRMELREQYGVASSGQGDAYIGSIEGAQKNQKELVSWLDSIEEIHRQRPPPSVMYSSKMPEFEALMEPWPDKFDDALKALLVPSSEMDLSFEDYARVVCSVLEIPVKGNIIESLHHLFALFAEFEGNQYFQTLPPH